MKCNLIAKTGSVVYGFDYSENAINDAMERTLYKKDFFHFEIGLMGEINYDSDI